jgi:hypothetical protein
MPKLTKWRDAACRAFAVRDDDFALACKVFDLFTSAQRAQALTVFARLRRFPCVRDRFFDAVYSVASGKRLTAAVRGDGKTHRSSLAARGGPSSSRIPKERPE